MTKLIKATSLTIVFSLLLSYFFYDEINSLLTYTYTEEITLAHSETVSIGILDILSTYLSNGVFYSTFAFLTSLNSWLPMLLGGVAVTTFALSRKHKESLTNTTKLWIVVIATYAMTQIITHNFDLNYLAYQWGFTVSNGASVPTSPYSLTTIGSMIEYHYWLSIKTFFQDFKWGALEIIIGGLVILWAAIKASSLAYDATKNQTSLIDLLLVPLAALLSLFSVIFLPYRLSGSSDDESTIQEKQLNDLFLRIGFSEKRAQKLTHKMTGSDSMISALKDNQASLIHTIMKIVKSK
ncbi:hypothetical protein [Aliivibrio finisterrensis]|uniref:Uncharacterized protein n=1 Tax=Aliivibrio finisterrensis TaxID=511998 RepID=A0ABY0I651_9GAMM|nr:hypothetical protein [Aliivibrio finisterrensis]RYU64359.1 hypothetical protein ERW53_10060 [Aliivibrio finisterrensis]RYU83971.1 hypothetical protein ERW52_11900 [Aliivibrio finisterrensis]